VTTWADVYGRQARDLRSSLETGPVVLAGVPGSGRSALAAEIASDRRQVRLRLSMAGTPAGLRQDAVHEVLRFLTAPGDPEDFETRVAKAFGVRAPDALALARGKHDTRLSFAEIVDAIPSESCVVVHGSPLLASSWAERALWTLRNRWQRGHSPWLVLLTRPWHVEALAGSEAPFFGFSRTIELSPPSLENWIAASGAEIPTEELAWLIQQTRGVARPTLAVLEKLEEGARDLPSAWTSHVGETRDAAAWAERLAGALHPYGPRLLDAIAADRPVYPAVPGARTDAIAAALRAMRDHDLIFQPTRRRWVVADPALAPHLAARSAARDDAFDTGVMVPGRTEP
jgi:hypothetical protein